MEFVLSWAFHRRPKDEAEKLKVIAAESLRDRRRKKEIRTMATALGQTWEEWAIEQRELGKAEGRAEGKAEGKAEGELRAARDILRNVLEDRFGKLPRGLLRKITNATDVERLKSCIQEALRAKSLEDLDL
jgi:flagellar biosynthesis/type III secretory pathway protein FliH